MNEQLITKSKEIRNILEDYFECTSDECLEIADFLNEYTYLDLYNIELNDCEDVADVMYELRNLI